VGTETLRTAAHLIGLHRDIPVLFLLYTIFPNPLRLYRDTLHAPIVPEGELRPLEPEERTEVEEFIAGFTRRATPIRAYREPALTGGKLRELGRHATVKALYDRDNDGEIEQNDLSILDHILLAPAFYRRVRDVRVVHMHDPRTVTDHFPVVDTLAQ
jgi:hypothetical protein